ncbi:MAG: ATP-binding protein [Paenibacillus sp.]|nr:ATP-binding protein [Paenibacillus sp.]
MRLAILLYTLLLPICISAASKRFYNASDIYGITITEPNSICKDDNGFIWISSKEGVLRLADNGSKMYRLPYTSMNVVSVEVVQSANHIAAFTNQGEIFMYDPITDRFDKLMNLTEKINPQDIYLSQIDFDRAGNIWIASSSGLFHLKNNEPERVEGVAGALGDMVITNDGKILTGGTGGIYTVDPSTMKVSKLSEVGQTFPILLRPDPKMNRIWVGTMTDGLYYVDLATRKFTSTENSSFPRQYVRDIEIIGDSMIWCGIDGRGIYELSRDGKRILNTYRENSDNPYSISGNGIQDMLYDKNDRIWVCTYTGGASIADIGTIAATMYAHRADTPNSLVNNYVYTVEKDNLGQLWIGTNGGLSCWDQSKDEWTNFFDNRGDESFIIQSVSKDSNGNIWVGTYSHGAYVIDPESKHIKAHHTMTDGILSKRGFVFSIVPDRNGDVWLGGMIGDILKYDRERNTFESYPSIPVTSMASLNDTTLLLISTNRLLSLNKLTKETRVLVSDKIIRGMEVVGDTVWMATSGNGIVSYDFATGQSETFGTSKGFPSNYINSLVYNEGKLWFSSNKGLYRFDPRDKTVSECRQPVTVPGCSFTPDAAVSIADGRTAWGTTKGLLIVSDDADTGNNIHGHIFLNDIFLSGQSIRENPDLFPDIPLDSITTLTLDYRHNNITFDILSTGTSSYPALFSYMLEGFDDTWNGPSDQADINYTNLPPGDYILKIRMHNPIITDQRGIKIRITPPYWKTLWFNTLILCIIAGAIISSFRTYVNRLNRRNAESKLQFFVSTAHDLRTALTLIKAPIEQLRESGRLSETDYGYLKLASANVDHLTSLTTKLMDFQKIDTDKTQANFSPVNIPEMVRQRIAMFSAYSDRKSITIHFNTPTDSYITIADAEMLEQIVDNLISNAIKYSSPESTINITFTPTSDSWSLSVADQGIGIPRKDRKKLFKEFYRGENAINSHITGSGIGLALVKKLVEIHEGTIKLKSEENVGSTFEISIPYREPIAETADTATVCETADDSAISGEHSGESEDEMRILIVEDNDDLRKFMTDALGGQFKVTAVADGEKAWEAVLKELPDLIVSDVMMPNMNGFELCQRVKSTFETSHIPVILLSALTGQNDELQGIGLGADEYLTKPFDIKTLSGRITSTIKNRRLVGLRTIDATHQEPEPQQPVNHLNDEFVKQAIEVITDHLDNSEFGKEEFAKEMGVSTSLLFKKIKSLTGLSIVDFIKKVRMEHALRLLEDPSLSIGDIAFRCGFSTVGYFSTVFKKYFGKTPSECRKE